MRLAIDTASPHGRFEGRERASRMTRGRGLGIVEWRTLVRRFRVFGYPRWGRKDNFPPRGRC